MPEAIVSEDLDRVRLLKFNRPRALNALNEATVDGLIAALAATENDDNIAVCILTGEGRAFCAGQDMNEMLQTGASPTQFSILLKQLANFRKPLLAAVNGIGVGFGMTVLGHCDLVLMAKSAKLRTPFPQLGLAPEAASSYTFPARLGAQDAAYVLMSGRWFSASECLDMGLVWRVVEDELVRDETLKVATELAVNPIPSLVATKQLMTSSGHAEQAFQAHLREVDAYKSLMGSAANREAVAAFLEKRAPDFSKIPGL